MNGWTAPIIFTWPRVVDRTLADGAVEHRVVLGLHVRRADDRVALVDPRDDLVDLVGRVAELLEPERHRAVDDRDLAAADELLRLDEREVRLDAGRVAIHHEADRPGRREHGRLRVAVAVHLAEVERRRPTPCGTPRADRPEPTIRVLDVPDRRAVHRHHAEHRRRVLAVAGERPHPRPRSRTTCGRRGPSSATSPPPRTRVPRRSRTAARAPSAARRGSRSRGRAGGSPSRSARSRASGTTSSRRGSPARGRPCRRRARTPRRRARRPRGGTSSGSATRGCTRCRRSTCTRCTGSTR